MRPLHQPGEPHAVQHLRGTASEFLAGDREISCHADVSRPTSNVPKCCACHWRSSCTHPNPQAKNSSEEKLRQSNDTEATSSSVPAREIVSTLSSLLLDSSRRPLHLVHRRRIRPSSPHYGNVILVRWAAILKTLRDLVLLFCSILNCYPGSSNSNTGSTMALGLSPTADL